MYDLVVLWTNRVGSTRKSKLFSHSFSVYGKDMNYIFSPSVAGSCYSHQWGCCVCRWGRWCWLQTLLSAYRSLIWLHPASPVCAPPALGAGYSWILELKKIIVRHPGKQKVVLAIEEDGSRKRVELDSKYNVASSLNFVKDIINLLEKDHIVIKK